MEICKSLLKCTNKISLVLGSAHLLACSELFVSFALIGNDPNDKSWVRARFNQIDNFYIHIALFWLCVVVELR